MSNFTYEQIVQQLKDDVIAVNPDLAPALELKSEPMVILIEAIAYRLMKMQTQINFNQG